MRRILLRTFIVGAALGLAFLSGCSTLETSSSSGRGYNVVAHRPQNPNHVRVKVSLQNRMVYVMEGNRPLLVTPTTIGKTGAVTPTGNFHVTGKIRDKRSNTY